MKERVFTSVPVDATTARVVSKGVHYSPDIKPVDYETDLPIPTKKAEVEEHDLTGVRFGRFTVIGMSAEKKNRWVVRCSCGKYAIRAAKSIKNPANNKDACRVCRHTEYLKRSDFWRRTGKNIEYFS